MHSSRISVFVVFATMVVSASAVSARMLFAPAEPISVDSRPRFLSVADIDQDGRDDVLLGSTRGTVSILYGSANSASLFEAPRIYSFGKRLRRPNLGDVDGDGITDIAIPDEGSAGVWVLLGRGDRRFAPPQFVLVAGVRPYSVAIANIDGVGGGDLVVGDRRKGRIRLRLNGGAFAFSNGPLHIVPGGLEQIECSDLDGDQLPELIALSTGNAGKVSIFAASNSGNGRAVYSDPVELEVDVREPNLQIADFDNDGTRDLAVLERARRAKSSRAEVMTWAANGAVSTHMSVAVDCLGHRRSRSCRARGIAAADFDDDGIVDLAVGLRGQSFRGALGNRRAGAVSILKGRGDTFVPAGVAPWLEKAPSELATGDFNGDGLPEIVAISNARSLLQAMWNLSD